MPCSVVHRQTGTPTSRLNGKEVNAMDIHKLAAWASIGSFIVAVVGLALAVWQERQEKKKRPPK